METVASMSVLVGKNALVQFGAVSVLCAVLDSRYAFGRTDLLVSPVSGNGQTWVEKSRVTEESK